MSSNTPQPDFLGPLGDVIDKIGQVVLSNIQQPATQTTPRYATTSGNMADSSTNFGSIFDQGLNIAGQVLGAGVQTMWNETASKCNDKVSCYLESGGVHKVIPTPIISLIQGMVDGGVDLATLSPDKWVQVAEGYIQYQRTLFILSDLTYIVAALLVIISTWGIIILRVDRPLYRYANVVLTHLASASILLAVVIVTLVKMLNKGRSTTDNPIQFDRDLGDTYWEVCTGAHLCLTSVLYIQMFILLFMCGDRALAFWRPALHYKWMQPVVKHGCLMACWIIGVVLGMLSLVSDGVSKEEREQGMHVCLYDLVHHHHVMLAHLLVEMVLGITMIVVYGIILCGVREKRKISKQAGVPVESLAGPDCGQQNKSSKLFAAITIIYMAFMIPNWVTRAFYLISKDPEGGGHEQMSGDAFLSEMKVVRGTEMSRRFSYLLILLPMFVILPMIAVKYKSTRDSVRACCCCKKRRMKDADGGRRNVFVAHDVRRSAVEIGSEPGWAHDDYDHDGSSSLHGGQSNGTVRVGHAVNTDSGELMATRTTKNNLI